MLTSGMLSTSWVVWGGKEGIAGLDEGRGGSTGLGEAEPATCIGDPERRFGTGGSGGGGCAFLRFPVTPAGVGVAGNDSIFESGIAYPTPSPRLKTERRARVFAISVNRLLLRDSGGRIGRIGAASGEKVELGSLESLLVSPEFLAKAEPKAKAKPGQEAPQQKRP